MRSPLFLSLLVLVGTMFPLYAQPTAAPVETVSHEMVVDVLKQLDCRWSVEDWKYNIELKNRKLVLYRLDNGKRLLLKSSIKDNPSLEVLNRYNEKTAVTTRAVRYEKFGVVLESGLDCQLGVSDKGLRKMVSRFVDDVADFEVFVAKNKGTTGSEPTVLAKGEKQKPPLAIAPDSDDREFVVKFPTNSPNWDTAWKITWDMETGKQANDQGLKISGGGSTKLFKIKKAYFKPGRQAEWIQVIEDAHPQEFYVPYYFRGTRFFDLGVGGYVTMSAKEGGAVSQLMGSKKQVIAELRDTGHAYKHGNITRRSEELTLYANFQASNYTYMVEYGFRDDGGIVFRHSPTGYNFFPHFDASHMHGSYWRIGMKLGPDGNNNVNQVSVVRLPTDPKEQADGGKLNISELVTETFVDWNPREFTRLRVTNPNYAIATPTKNGPALPISYDLVTYPQGIARHERFPDEKFTAHDFWITRHDGPEKTYIKLGDYFYPQGGGLSQKLLPLNKKNVVLWHSSSGLHTPRAEDGIIGGNSTNNGQAVIYWTTFELRPRNLFTRTPLYKIGEDAPPKVDVKKKGTIIPKLTPP